MKLQVEGKKFTEALALAKGIAGASKSQSLPILQMVRLETSLDRPDVLMLEATDLERGLRMEVPATVQAAGSVALDATRLHAIAKELTKNGITMAVGESFHATITGNGSKYRLPGISTEDFPPTRALSGERAVTVAGSLLAQGLKQAVLAVSTDDSRYNLRGVFFEAEGETLKLTSSDGHRLIHLQVPLKGAVAERWTALVPGPMVKTAADLLKGAEDATVTVGDGVLDLTVGSTTLLTRLIEGSFPDYQRIIPKNHPHTIVVETAPLTAAVRKTMVISEVRLHPVALEFEPGRLLVKAQNPEAGEVEVEVPTEGDATTRVGLNARYLMDWLGLVSSKTLTVTLKGETEPVLFTSDTAPVYVISPMRI